MKFSQNKRESFKNKGEDGVVICQVENGQPLIVQAFNKGQDKPIRLSNPSAGLSKTSVKLENGHLICSFRREKSLPNIGNYFDLHNKYFTK